MKSDCRIFIFRHGITDWNQATKFQGHSDIPLNQEGRAQAAELVSYFDELKPEVILCSDLVRAIQTANIANQKLKAPMFLDAKLREFNLGKAEGLLRIEVEALVGAEGWNQWFSVDAKYNLFGFPGGETKLEVVRRVMDCISHYLDEHNEKTIAVSSHGGVIKSLCHFLKEMPTEDIPIKNCCMYELNYSREARALSYIRLVK